MRPVGELINANDPGWLLVERWIKSAKNTVEVLPADSLRALDALYKTQVTTRSPLGAVIYKTGGILIDSGWIRILGSGSEKLTRSLPEWNKGKSFREYGETPTILYIADDAIGGLFVLNGGGLGEDVGKVYYLSPDRLEFEPLNRTYTEFLQFCFKNDLDEFYEGNRWRTWRSDMSKLPADKAFSFYPPLWSREYRTSKNISRKIVSIDDIYKLNLETRRQIQNNK
ncbi:MAG: DUF2625 domain-containing protein [Chitinophagaceae bacterium]|nr:MAG: DUF2625 domain-containing protein [Chitinophagaceae bacterium]